ncbi:MAG: ABC transporter ATP-binding protein/permease, partial [Schleiferiaceae bacterium]|nr:ABC transporter ATP-binding protein/permease [Schleiferiaceae bacterium]
MKNLIAILRLALHFKGKLVLNVVFTTLGVLFSIFSLALLIPVLDILFQSTEGQFVEIVAAGSGEVTFTKEGLGQLLTYQIALLVVTYGKHQALLVLCGILVSAILFKNVFNYLGVVFLSLISNGVIRDTRKRLYEKITSLHLGFFSGERKGDLLSRMTTDMKEIEWAILSAVDAGFKAPFEILGTIVFLYIMSPELTLFLLLFLPISGLIIGLVGRTLRKTSEEGQRKMGDLLSLVEETIGGLRVIKAFHAHDFVNQRFRERNDAHYKLMVRVYRRSDLASPMTEFLGVTSVAVLLYFGGNLVFNGDLEASVFLVYIILFSQLIPPFKTFSKATYNAQRGIASLRRVEEITNTEVAIRDAIYAKPLPNFTKAIAFENISFKYTDQYVLRNINFTIPKGKTTALVGQSGSGKSTLSYLLPRFYDLDEGCIRIDGKDIRDITIESLRAQMGIVAQESVLFNDTVFNNIAFGIADASLEAVTAAAKIANAHQFIMDLEQGYDSNIGDGGGKLSGGQRQRISIARAVLKNPSILILDEATSALDTESERLVQDALTKLMSNRTSLIIAHRLSTIRHADEILVLENGEIKERGTHEALLQA